MKIEIDVRIEDDRFRATCLGLGVSAAAETVAQALRNLAVIMASASSVLVGRAEDGTLRPEQQKKVPFAKEIQQLFREEQKAKELWRKGSS